MMGLLPKRLNRTCGILLAERVSGRTFCQNRESSEETMKNRRKSRREKRIELYIYIYLLTFCTSFLFACTLSYSCDFAYSRACVLWHKGKKEKSTKRSAIAAHGGTEWNPDELGT